MKTIVIISSVLSIILSCTSTEPNVYLGQGIMSGEASSTSIILQARLTISDSLVNGDLIGVQGEGIFQIDQEPTFDNPINTERLYATSKNDFMLKTKIKGLKPGNKYYYRLRFGTNKNSLFESETGSFKTLMGAQSASEISFAVVTGMNYYHFHYGRYDYSNAYSENDKNLGYPSLASIMKLAPDYFIGTGDNVYFDHPDSANYAKAIKAGKNPHPGGYDGRAVIDKVGMRRKYHEQFAQARFRNLFKNVGTYWEKDDHDYRYNDADTILEVPISHQLGIQIFKEQLPVVDPEDVNAITYRTHRMNADLQIWLLEGRDYRSPNSMIDGPNKTLLGQKQLEWLKETLIQSEARFKLIISPTPMVGPDDAYKSDNHVNHNGFRYEGEELFTWLMDNGFLEKNLYIICGDRHWQYHAMHPSGFEEFSTGALVDNNARPGRLAGDPNSTDPEGVIKQFYIQGDKESASGGFLFVKVKRENDDPILSFQHFDEMGNLLYEAYKTATF